MTDSAAIAEMFARAKRDADFAVLAARSGFKLVRAGNRLRGECPFGDCSKGKGADGAFSADPRSKLFKCWKCDAKGDVLDYAAKLWLCTPREAAERIVGAPVPSSGRKAEPAPRREERTPAPAAGGVDERPKAPKWIAGLLAEARPILGTPAAAYLYGRGISSELVNAAASPRIGRARLLFHPRCPYDWDEDARDWRRLPAMIGLVEAVSGFTGGIHCTYLGRTGPADSWGKAAVRPAKKMWGPQADIVGRPGGVWLLDTILSTPTVVAEGIESAFSAAQLFGGACGVLAALSLGRLQGGWATDKWGRRDPELIRPDPGTPALTWPGDGPVIVAVDHDMSPLPIKRRKAGPKGGTYTYEMTATDRAKVCASLAEQAWRAAGRNPVRAIAPPPGSDFNDELMRKRGLR